MQLQAERDHFINGGIRAGGGGSSSSSLSSSPTSSPTLPSSPLLSPSSKVELDPQHLLRLRNAFTHRQQVPSPPTPPPPPAFTPSAQSTFSSSPSHQTATSNAAATARPRPSPMPSRAGSPVIPDLTPLPSVAPCQPTVATVPPAQAGQLALLPSEILFHILCRLSAIDLCRLALTSKFHYALARDRAVWRIKCRQHILFSTRHLYAQPSVDWFAYYRYLHRSRRALDQNWASATPQSVTILEGHSSLVTSLELSLWTLVTASLDSTVRVWNLKTFECIQVLRCKHSITCVTQCDSIGVVCARTSFGALIVWDIKTGQVILQDNDALPQIASFMWMNEQYIGYGTPDGSVTIFDWSSRSELRVAGSYQEHTGDVIHVSMLGNQIVISASTSGEALLYSLPKRRLIGRFLLPGAAQSIQFTPTISGNKVMFSTREAVYEYELDIQELVASFSQEVQREEDMEAQRRLTGKSSGPSLESAPSPSSSSSSSSSPLSSSSSSLSSPLSASSLSSPCVSPRPTPQFHSSNILGPPNRNWKPSNSLLSQIRQKIGHGRLVALSVDDGPQSPSSWTGSSSSAASSPSLASSTTTTETTPATTPSSAVATGTSTTTTTMARTIPTRFPQLKSVYCIRPGSRILDHGTTSARCSYGVFMRQGCATLSDVSVYSRATKRLQTWRGAAVDRMLRDARRSNYYTTMECNEHCAVITSGDRIYVVSFLPHGV